MKAALHILGYDDVYHGTDVYSNIKDCDMWIDALNAKYFGKGKPFGRAEFDKLLGHCAAITDGPANCFGPELIDAYPTAKVVLVERDFDAVSIRGALCLSFALRFISCTPFAPNVFPIRNFSHFHYRNTFKWGPTDSAVM
jgi:hypothetical protein